MHNAPITIVIVEYHSRPEIDRALESIHQFEPDAEVIVSSNSCYSDHKWSSFVACYPSVRFLRNPENVGYARAVNIGLRETTAPYIAVLNPDVVLLKPLSPSILSSFSEFPAAGVVGPKVLNGRGDVLRSFRRFYTPELLVAKYTPLGRLGLVRRMLSRNIMADVPDDAVVAAGWVSGGALIVRRLAYEEVGGMDERYFLYMEDMDWCRSFWEAGWMVIHDPRLRLVHNAKHDGTRRGLGGVASLSTRRMLRSYMQYLIKHGFGAYEPEANVGTLTPVSPVSGYSI